jgi:hypothetical protein
MNIKMMAYSVSWLVLQKYVNRPERRLQGEKTAFLANRYGTVLYQFLRYLHSTYSTCLCRRITVSVCDCSVAEP